MSQDNTIDLSAILKDAEYHNGRAIRAEIGDAATAFNIEHGLVPEIAILNPELYRIVAQSAVDDGTLERDSEDQAGELPEALIVYGYYVIASESVEGSQIVMARFAGEDDEDDDGEGGLYS